MSDAVQYIVANGIRFAYLTQGTGPLLLMIHGFPDTAHTWDLVRPLVAQKGYRVVCPFTRGYAPSAVPDRDADAETISRDVLALIDAFGEKQATVVAHDWGSAAAYGAAALDSSKIKKLITIGIPHPATLKPTAKNMWGARHFLIYKIPGAAQRFAKNDFAAMPKIYKRWSPTWNPDPNEFTAAKQSLAEAAHLNAAFGYYRKLSFVVQPFMKTKITCPTVTFAGLDDPIAKIHDYERATRMFKNGYTIEKIPGGHFMHREYPDIFAERLLAHL